MSDLNDTLEKLARARNRKAEGMGTFLETLDRLQSIERQLDRAISEPFNAFDPANPAFLRRQAD